MADCPLVSGCPFFNDKMANMPSMAEMYKKKYCKSDFDNCARWVVCQKKGKEKVPGDLFPNQMERTLETIA